MVYSKKGVLNPRVIWGMISFLVHRRHSMSMPNTKAGRKGLHYKLTGYVSVGLRILKKFF